MAFTNFFPYLQIKSTDGNIQDLPGHAFFCFRIFSTSPLLQWNLRAVALHSCMTKIETGLPELSFQRAAPLTEELTLALFIDRSEPEVENQSH